MRLTRARDDAAFTEFAAAVTPRLFRSALLMCGDWHLAEDLVQTTLGKLYVAWPKVERADSAEAYARGTLTKTFLSHKRIRRNAELPQVDLGDRTRLARRTRADRARVVRGTATSLTRWIVPSSSCATGKTERWPTPPNRWVSAKGRCGRAPRARWPNCERTWR